MGIFPHKAPPQLYQKLFLLLGSYRALPGQCSFFLFGLYPQLWSAGHLTLTVAYCFEEVIPSDVASSRKVHVACPEDKPSETNGLKYPFPLPQNPVARNSVPRKSLKEIWAFSVQGCSSWSCLWQQTDKRQLEPGPVRPTDS